MKFSAVKVILFFMAIMSVVVSLPTLPSNDVPESIALLEERDVKFPINVNDDLTSTIMANLKVKLNNEIFAKVSASFCEQAVASLKIEVSLLGGLIRLGDVHLRAIQSATIKNLKASLDGSLNALLDLNIYNPLKSSLNNLFHSKSVDKQGLLSILTALNNEAKAIIQAKLPKIALDLEDDAKNDLDLAIKGVEINLPAILKLNVDLDIDIGDTLKRAIKAGIEVAGNLDPKVTADVLVKAL